MFAEATLVRLALWHGFSFLNAFVAVTMGLIILFGIIEVGLIPSVTKVRDLHKSYTAGYLSMAHLTV
jgi:hypothetical protein